jgi:hypothetical protein
LRDEIEVKFRETIELKKELARMDISKNTEEKLHEENRRITHEIKSRQAEIENMKEM